MTTCTIIRHAEKELGDYFNPRLRHQDEPISAYGRTQAEKLAAYLAHLAVSGPPVTAIFVSGYLRALQTIQPAADRLNLTPIVDERLNEIDNGYLERMSDQEIQHTYPEIWNAFQDRRADFRFPQGETGEEALKRISGFLIEKQREYAGGHIVAVAHDGIIRAMMCYICGIPVYQRWNFRVDFAGITEICDQPGRDDWKLVRFNQVILDL